MKTLLVLLILFTGTIFVPALSALDYGGTMENETAAIQQPFTEFTQYNKFLFWVDTDLGKHLKFRSAASVSLSTFTPHVYADFDSLTLSGEFSHVPGGATLFTFQLGRFAYSDPSRRVFSQDLDGIQFAFTYPLAQLEMTLGYTGLINKLYADPIMSKYDYSDYEDNSKIFASPRVLTALNLKFPELFARQTPELSVLIQTDMRPYFQNVVQPGDSSAPPGGGGRVDTQYYGLGISGPLVENLFYSLYGYLGAGQMLTYQAVDPSVSTTGMAYEYNPILGSMIDANLHYFIPQFFHTAVSGQFLWASGDSSQNTYYEGNTSGTFTSFLPVDGETLGLAFTPQASNLAAFVLGVSAKPFADQRGLISSL
ncbi:MAG: hypothetical protein HKM06_05665 [Spirochaetales bacterium]|nr:hypothetical protein [Spirochaetales bacterium]